MPIQSQLFRGRSGKQSKRLTVFECPACGSQYSEIIGNNCRECDEYLDLDRCQTTTSVEAAVCTNCSDEVPYIRENIINSQWNIPGYICSDCDNILEIDFQSKSYQPIDFLQNSLNGIQVVSVDNERLEMIGRIFSLQTKVDNIGFWSYKPEEHRMWIASKDGVYCGFVVLNKDNVLIQIWVDEGMRRQGIASKLLEYISGNILPSNGKLHINQPLDDGWDFFRSLADQNDQIFGRDVMMHA
ncbi:GNAT family N-acetyltransferase [Haloarchaeobius litoreus]|uniref:GNAT family N-acetyltransferase n=1 Tax=Haloarchaeobius litoreus TaxID=755306 RepID=A0ABD6DMI3_9EURY|nr:GNAT family N-acetyltransferase [Haloarchaeobius litoreus]